jgi:hypothetical protein
MDGVFLFSFILLFRLVFFIPLLEFFNSKFSYSFQLGWERDHSIPDYISHHPLDFQFITRTPATTN